MTTAPGPDTANTSLEASLALGSRGGLPDGLAYLRGNYPKPTWRGHVNFGQLTAFWLDVHQSLRDHGRELQHATRAFREGRLDAFAYRAVFVPRLNHFHQHLEGHHQIEDGVYFPKFRALDPRMVAGFDLLERDHDMIHEALVGATEGARTLLAVLGGAPDAIDRASETYAAKADHLNALLLRHLADEEDLIVPAMLHHGERHVR